MFRVQGPNELEPGDLTGKSSGDWHGNLNFPSRRGHMYD